MDIITQFGKLTFTFEVNPDIPLSTEIYRQVGIPMSLSSNFDIAINGIKLDDHHGTIKTLGIARHDTIRMTRNSKEEFPEMRLPQLESTDEEISVLKATKEWTSEAFVKIMRAARIGDTNFIRGSITTFKTYFSKENYIPENVDGITPLMVAARFGQVEVIQTLLEIGANLLWKDKDGRDALIIAIQYDQYETATEIFKKNFNTTATDQHHWTALMWAIWKEHTDLIELLSQYTTSREDAAILVVKLFPENTKLIDMFINGHLSYAAMKNVLETAAQHGRVKLIEHILSKRFVPDGMSVDSSGRLTLNSKNIIPLSMFMLRKAIRFNQIPTLEWLLRTATEEQIKHIYDQRDEHGDTFLMTAARHNRPQAIMVLLNYLKKNLNATNKDGDNILELGNMYEITLTT